MRYAGQAVRLIFAASWFLYSISCVMTLSLLPFSLLLGLLGLSSTPPAPGCGGHRAPRQRRGGHHPGLGTEGYADGRGTAARFKSPRGLALDGQGNLYVADTENGRIRKIVIATGEVSTVAGGPESGLRDGKGDKAQFKYPNGLAADGKGTLYVADVFGDHLDKIELSSRTVTTLAGGAESPQNEDERGNSDGIGQAAQFHYPTGLSLEGGNLYVANGATVRRIALRMAEVSTVAGYKKRSISSRDEDGIGDNVRFNDVSSVAADGRGNLYVADMWRLRKIVLASGAVSTVVGSGDDSPKPTPKGIWFKNLAGIVSDGDILYVTDRWTNCLYRVEAATGAVTVLAGEGGRRRHGGGRPTFLSQRHSDGQRRHPVHRRRRQQLHSGGEVRARREAASYPLASPPGGAARCCPRRLALPAHLPAPLGLSRLMALSLLPFSLLLALTGALRPPAPAPRANGGVVSTLAGGTEGYADGRGLEARFRFPTGLALDGHGNLYVSEKGNHRIRKVVIATGEVSTVAGGPESGFRDGPGPEARFNSPGGLAADGRSTLYVADADGHRIRKIEISTGTVSTMAGSGTRGYADGPGPAAQLSHPGGLSLDGACTWPTGARCAGLWWAPARSAPWPAIRTPPGAGRMPTAPAPGPDSTAPAA